MAVPIMFLGLICRVAAEHGLTCRVVARGLRWVGLAVVVQISPVAGTISLVPRCLVVGSGQTFSRRMQACRFRGPVAVTVLRWGMSRGLVLAVVEHHGLAVAAIDPAVAEELVLTGRVSAAGCRSARVRAALEGAEIDPAAETGRAEAKGRIGRAEESSGPIDRVVESAPIGLDRAAVVIS